MPDATATNRTITIFDHAAFGEMVKGWSKNHTTWPKTIKELKEQVAAAVTDGGPPCLEIGPGFDEGENVKLVPLPATSEVLSFAIPSAKDIAVAPPTGDYPLPDFYEEMAYADRKKIANKDAFRSSRIGDYAAGKCM